MQARTGQIEPFGDSRTKKGTKNGNRMGGGEEIRLIRLLNF